MGVEQVKQHLAKYQLSESIITLDESSASVEEAAKALHIQPEQVAKSLTFSSEEGCIMILLAGDRKVHNGKFKRTFHTKPHMLSSDQVLAYTNPASAHLG
nr:YbaK/EbsC family protein [Dubosiella newyorkensis]